MQMSFICGRLRHTSTVMNGISHSPIDGGRQPMKRSYMSGNLPCKGWWNVSRGHECYLSLMNEGRGAYLPRYGRDHSLLQEGSGFLVRQPRRISPIHTRIPQPLNHLLHRCQRKWCQTTAAEGVKIETSFELSSIYQVLAKRRITS